MITCKCTMQHELTSLLAKSEDKQYTVSRGGVLGKFWHEQEGAGSARGGRLCSVTPYALGSSRTLPSTQTTKASSQDGWQVAARLLVHERLDVERLHDVGVELRVQVRIADALVQQLPHLRTAQHGLL